MELKGFIRSDGKIGIRNLYLLIGVCDAVEGILKHISTPFEDVIFVTSEHGCPAAGNEQVVNNLAGLADNPNIAGVVMISMGCEGVRPETVREKMTSHKPVSILKVTEIGGSTRTIRKAQEIIKDMKDQNASLKREPFDVSQLVVGLKCGGSDTTSGIAGNPSVGSAMDRFIDMSGTAIFTEPIECIGGEEALIRRAVNEKVAQDIKHTLAREEKRWTIPGVELEFMCIGNVAGGLTTIEEKSLGAIHKSGSRKIAGVLEYSEKMIEKPGQPGMYLQDGTMLHSHCITHLAAAGCQMLIFITGNGAPVGSRMMPTITVCGNPLSYEKLKDDMDINAGQIITGAKTVEQVGEIILNKIFSVANGEQPKTEGISYSGFSIYRRDPRLECLLFGKKS